MTTSAELREKRANIANQMSEVVKKDKLTPEDEQSFDRMEAEERELKVKIDRLEKVEKLNADLGEIRSAPIGREERVVDTKLSKESATAKRADAFRSYLQHGINEMSPDLRPYLAKVNFGDEQRTLSAVTGASGGYTVPQDFEHNLIEVLKSFNGVRQAPVSVLTTESGNDIPVPVSDDTSNKGELIGENTQTASDQDPTFSQVTLKSFMFSSKVVLVPIQLLQDNAVNLDVELPKLLGTRIGRNQADYFTTGTGTSQPQGIVVGAATTGLNGAGTDYLPTFDEVLDIIHTVDPAYRQDPSCGFMFNDTTLKGLKKLKDTQNRPLWLPGLAIKEPDTINGYPYWINQSMASVGTANKKAILFGAMANYRIRDVRGVTLLRLQERYADYFQVGMLAFQRSDARMLNSAAIKYWTTKAT